jgi:pimeloyl-ACP methyl ester carboxylesterase
LPPSIQVAFVAALALGVGLSSAPARAEVAGPASDANSAPYPRLTLEALRQKYALPGAHIAPIGGLDVYYMDEGSGPAILMIHGSVSSLRTWDGVAARLKRHYRVIRYDIPPQGLSGPVSDEAAAKLKPIDIPIALLDRLGVRKVTVMGVSSGGTMGMFLAAARPDLVDRLILSNTPSDPVTTTQLVESDEFKAAQAQAAKTHFQSQHFWNLFLDYFSGDPRHYSPALREQYYDMNRRTPEKHEIALVAVVADHAKAVAAMSAVKAPTLLIWGAADPLLTPKSANVLEGYLTGTQVSKVFLTGVGHYPPLEAPDRFTDVALAFLQAAAPPPDAGGR